MTNEKLIKFFWIALILQVIPVLLLWDSAYIRIHDTLEGELNWYHMLQLSGTGLSISSETIVPQIMNGLPRITLHSPFNITFWFMELFGVYWGYLIQKIVLIGIAFAGMYWFIRDEISGSSPKLAMGIATIYSWIPFYSVFGCSFAGLPLMAWSFKKIINSTSKWFHWIILLAFPFWSSIVWAAPSVLLLFFVYTIWDIKKQGFRKSPWIVMALMAILYLLANYPLISTMFNPPDGFISHREDYDFKKFSPFTIGNSIAETVYSIFLGHYHVGTFFTGLIWTVVLIALFYGQKALKYLIAAVLLISLFGGFYSLVILLFVDQFALVETFRFDRVRMLLPFLNLVLLASALMAFHNRPGWNKTIGFVLVCQVMITIFLNDEFIHNIRHLTGFDTKPAYRQYFDADLLNEVDGHINRDKSTYRIIHLGMNPAISQHFGFYTLDGLQSVYSFDHKMQFQKIIQTELDKNSVLNDYFTLWGNRCYLFSSELGKEDSAFLISKKDNRTVKQLDVNTDIIRAMGGKYVFSGLPVENAIDLGWELERVFKTEKSYYSIYLYRL